MTDKKTFTDTAKERFDSFRNQESVNRATEWVRTNQQKIETLFEYPILRDFVFEPVKGIFKVPGDGEVRRARIIITQVALVNAVIAGLPGSLGVGVFVSLGLELWMAYALSRTLGLGLTRDQAINTVVGWAASAGLVLVGFKAVLNLTFPVVTALMPIAGFGTAITQLVVTNLFGVIFWIMFEELREGRKFAFPMTSAKRLVEELSALLRHQFDTGAQALNPANLITIGQRLKAWLTGEVPTDLPRLRGEFASIAAMIFLLRGQADSFESPLANEFIGAIRDRYPDLAHASISEISEHMQQYTSEQMIGVISLIKGKLFERLVARYENQDSDAWVAALHDDESYPGSDLIFENLDTGETLEVSLKATNDLGYLEESLAKYPEFPIVSTDEVAFAFGNEEFVWASGITNEQVTEITEDNFEALFESLAAVEAAEVAVASTGTTAAVTLWPFVVAHVRGRIDGEQLTQVCTLLLPETGKVLASRLAYAAVLGPVFAWWLLARAVMSVGDSRDEAEIPKRRLLILR